MCSDPSISNQCSPALFSNSNACLASCERILSISALPILCGQTKGINHHTICKNTTLLVTPGPGQIISKSYILLRTNHSNLACPLPSGFTIPNASPALPNHSLAPPKTVFAIPAPAPFFLLAELLPIVAEVLGSTFSPALKDTNREKGTSHTQIPKKALISVNVGKRLGKLGSVDDE